MELIVIETSKEQALIKKIKKEQSLRDNAIAEQKADEENQIRMRRLEAATSREQEFSHKDKTDSAETCRIIRVMKDTGTVDKKLEAACHLMSNYEGD